MQNQGTTWQKRRKVIILVALGIIAGFLPDAVPMNWVWVLVCWLVWGSCTIRLIFIVFSSKTLRNVALIIISITLAIGGLRRVGEQWLKDHPPPGTVYRLPVNHLPDLHKAPVADKTAGPVVTINAVLVNFPNRAPYYTVNNGGPTDVLQLRTQVLSHKVRKNGEIGSAGYGDEYVEKLYPHTSLSYDFPEHCLDLPKMSKQSAEVSAVEIRLTYSYGADRKKAVKSAFYFLNPKGFWVEESDPSLTPKIYDPVKKSLSDMQKQTEGFQNEPDTGPKE